MEPEDPSPLLCPASELDDASLVTLMGQLDASALASAAQACRRWRDSAESSLAWRLPFERAHSEWLPVVAAAPPATVHWREQYRRRCLTDRNWAAGAPSSSVALRCHSGPVFAACFLQPPFPPNLALSAGVLGRHERAELTVWDLQRKVEGVGRLGWQVTRAPAAAAAAGSGGGGQQEGAEGPEAAAAAAQDEDPLAGAFCAAQRPGTRQVAVCGFSHAIHIYSLHQACEGEQQLQREQEEGTDEPADRGSYGAAAPHAAVGAADDPALDDVERRVDTVLQLRAASNLKYASRLDPDALPSPGDVWRSRQLASLVGHDAACPMARWAGKGALLTASFDGSVRLWRLPPDLGAEEGGGQDGASGGISSSGSGGGGGSAAGGRSPDRRRRQQQQQQREVRHVLPAATFRDSELQIQNPLDLHNRAVCAVAAAPDLSGLASGGNDGLLKLWDVERQQVTSRLEGHEGWIWCLEPLGPSFSALLSGATDGTVRLWDARSGQCEAAMPCSAGEEGSGAAAGAGDEGDDGTWPVAGLAVRRDGRYAAVGSFDHAVHMVDLRERRRVGGAMHGHLDRVTRVSASEDGDAILSASFDGDVRLWSFAP